MKTSHLAKLGLVGLAYSGIFVMGAADSPREVVSREAKEAFKQADRAAKALARHRGDEAVAAAESAVAFAPQAVGYRLLLAQSYLEAGRFRSAQQAFADVLTLSPGHGKAALNLALSQIAGGDWQAARATLAAHTGDIPASDRGLAMALAGDTQGAVQVLTAVVRSPEATVKARQNLALAYALGGQWQAARVVAAADMSPADVDLRLEQWAAFVQPRAASDQVASLLGVRPSLDAGQPTRLALNAEPTAAPVAIASAPTVEPEPVVAPSMVAAVVRGVRFGPRQEVVQALPAALIASDKGPIKVAAGFAGVTAKPLPVRAVAAAPAALASGNWYVQLGAYDSAGVAKDAWARAQRRYASFAGHSPNGMSFQARGANFYRLSVGGFSRAAADGACRQYRASGGTCFVRPGAGDQVAAWARKGSVQLAMR